MTDKVKPDQQYGSHIDSMPVERNAPAPAQTKVSVKEEPRKETIDEFLARVRKQ